LLLFDRLRERDYIISCGLTPRPAENGRLELPAGNLEKKTSRLDTLERVQVSDRLELRRWLDANRATSPGMWLVTFRSVTGKPRPRYDEVVDELVSFGWIDSKLVKLDETRAMLLCTPRKPGSHWSASNKERFQRLVSAGLVRTRGLETIAIAKANGSCEFLDTIDRLEEPPDFAGSLDGVDGARQHWDDFPGVVPEGHPVLDSHGEAAGDTALAHREGRSCHGSKHPTHGRRPKHTR
jgi:uncharacterized protein YdeI (YjbR/CyaY-like superfamily)